MKRNPAIELYRIFLMFTIVWLHTLCQGPYCNIPMRSMLAFGVPGFVFISGYFGIKFKWRKLLGLYGIAVFASLIAPLVNFLVGNVNGVVYWNEVLRVWNPESGFWFLHAYAALMVMSPFLNSAIPADLTKETISALLKRTLPLLIMVFVFFGLRSFNHFRAYMPNIPGGQALIFCALYMIGRLVSITKIDNRVPLWGAAFMVVVALLVSYFSKGLLNFWFPLAAAVFLFVLFSRIHVKENSLVGRAILVMSPCMFGVYCIHGTIRMPFAEMADFGTLNYLSEKFAACGNVQLGLVFSAGVAFLVAFLIEWLRRVLIRFLINTSERIIS